MVMEQFTASNGMWIAVDGHPFALVNSHGITTQTFSSEDARALREFFQHERDEELGRWRWPDNSNVVAWKSRRSNEKDVTVLDEATGYVGYYTRADVADVHPGEGVERRASRAYFEAHPERKPWEDAKPGEVWVLTLEGDESAWTMGGKGKFEDPESTLKPDSPMITAGCRIWPASDD